MNRATARQYGLRRRLFAQTVLVYIGKEMSLNPNPNAVRFLETLAIPTGRKALLGDPNTFANDNVRRVLNNVHQDVSASLDVLKKLPKDESRTSVQQNHRGKLEADRLNGVLASARDQLREIAEKTEADATAKINAKMTLDPSRAILHSRKLDWISKQWADPNGGSAAITKQVKADPELAALMLGAEAYILGISDDARSKFVETSVKTHTPDAYADMQTADRLRHTADKYDGAMNSVRSSFYIAELAERISTRVE